MPPMMNNDEYIDGPTRRSKGNRVNVEDEYGIHSLEVEETEEWENKLQSFFPQDKIIQGILAGGLIIFLIVIIKLVHVTASAAKNGPLESDNFDNFGYSNPYRDVDPQWRVRPKNFHLALLGDSITHYQYLSLVYFLRTGRWFDPNFKKSHLTNVYSYENIFHDDLYGEYFFQTTRLLQPTEICDCVYPKGAIDEYRLGAHRVIINRYFHDVERNNTVRFFHAFGHEHNMQGRLYASNITDMEGKEQDGLLNGEHQFRQPDVVWTSNNWSQVVTDHIATLKPKPEYFVLNAGQQTTEFINDRSKVHELNQSLHDMGIKRAYWRTSTFQRGGKPFLDENAATDELMCQSIGGCLNVSWTQSLSKLMYWDQTHNWEPVYRVINEDLMEEMGVLPNGYAKFNRSLLLD